MRVGLVLPRDKREIPTMARWAEDRGFDQVACGEHVFFLGATANAFESPWFCRRLGLLDFDQGLVGPMCIVERGFELGGWDVAEVAV